MYGDIKITLVKTETLAEYVVRTFALERVSLESPGDLGCLRGGTEATCPPAPAQEQEGRRPLLPSHEAFTWEPRGAAGKDRKLSVCAGDAER